MYDSFLRKFFKILDIPEGKVDDLIKDFNEIIYYKAITSLFTDISNEKKESLKKLFLSNKVDAKVLGKWIEDNHISSDKDFLTKYNKVLQDSYKAYFSAFLVDLDDERRSKVIDFANEYLK